MSMIEASGQQTWMLSFNSACASGSPRHSHGGMPKPARSTFLGAPFCAQAKKRELGSSREVGVSEALHSAEVVLRIHLHVDGAVLYGDLPYRHRPHHPAHQ